MIKRHLHLKFTCLLFLAVGIVQNSVALSNGIALKLLNYTVQTSQGTVDLGRTVTINALVTNTDTVAFEGTLDFGLRNTLNNLSGNNDIFKKPRFSAAQVNLQPGESVPAIFSVDVEGPYFKPGPDVVVVWPISTAPVIDTILIELDIQGPADLKNDIGESSHAPIGYLILSEKIQILNWNNENPLKQVRIFAISGQQLLNTTGNDISEIGTGTLPKGIYLCEFIFADNRKQAIKFTR